MTRVERALADVSKTSVREFISQLSESIPEGLPKTAVRAWLKGVQRQYERKLLE